MQLQLEIFFTRIEAQSVTYFRQVLNITHETISPDCLVHQVLQREFSEVGQCHCLMVHSTSWRHSEEGQIYLTYLVYCEQLDFKNKPASYWPMGQLELAYSPDPCHPQPEKIEEHHVLSHGYRHLSFLLQQNPTLAYPFSFTTLTTFKQIGVALAGNSFSLSC
jgi:hypothetical protein